MARITPISVVLGPVKERWLKSCRQRGVSPSEGVRQLVCAALEHEGALPDICVSPPGEALRPFTIRLAAGERTEIAKRARAQGFSLNRWIVSLVRARILCEPQPGEPELKLLGESNQHLAVIRMQLGALVRRGGGAEGPYHPEQVREMIDAHLQTVTRLLRSNLDRWNR